MFERVVIVPDNDNDGQSLDQERAAIEGQLLDIAGGFTSDRVSGAWRDETGKVYRDASTRYTLAVDASQDAAIVAAIPQWCGQLRQECVFTSVRPVSVAFVTAAVAAAA